MPRKPRIHYPGALYHVICRGNNKDWIFKSDTEKQEYKTLIEHYKKRYGFKIFSWVILSNHAHLLIEVGDVPLSKIMQGIQQNYTQWFNRTHKRTGHVFEQRYKAIHCNKDTYLLSLIRYIHQNPVRAKLEGGLNYRWSSHGDYVKHQTGHLTDIQFPLGLFSEEISTASIRYLDYMDEDEETIGTLKPSALEEGTQDHQPESQNKKIIRKPLSELIEIVAQAYGMTSTELTRKSRARKYTEARRVLMLLVADFTSVTQLEVAVQFGVSTSAISQMTIAAQNDIGLREKTEAIAVSV